MNMIIRLACILVVFCARFASAQPAAAPQVRQWIVDGVDREAMVYVPANAGNEPTPVIFLFHGHGGNMKEVFQALDFSTVWPEAIVVAPQGLKTPGQLVDRAGKYSGWQQEPGDRGDRDIHLVDQILVSLTQEYKIDPKRIYATGHSNGGGFTYLLWAMRGDVFAAVAPSAAVANSVNDKLKPKPVMHIMGNTDALVRPAWQRRQISALLRLNKCSAKGQSLTDHVTEYASEIGTPVRVYIHAGGHVYPPDAVASVVDFFKAIR